MVTVTSGSSVAVDDAALRGHAEQRSAAGPILDGHDDPVVVTALLVVQDEHAPHLVATLQAVLEQDVRPGRLVVVDATASRGARGVLTEAGLDADEVSWVVVPVEGRRPRFAEIVDTAVDALPGPGEELVVARRPRARAGMREPRPSDRDEWLWLLHEDSLPDRGALRRLAQVVTRSDLIGIAGCTVRDVDRPEDLVEVGVDLTRTGRQVGPHAGEVDQGQYANRRDVLAVNSAGMLIRQDVYLALGGFDPAFDGHGDGLDLSWRTHLLGHQVVVVPDAVVHETRSEQSGRTRKRYRQVALSRCAWWVWPLMSVWVALSSAALALLMLVLKRPRRALIEARQATAPFGVLRIGGARRRFRSRRVVPRRHLSALFVPPLVAVRDGWDAVRAALTPERTPSPGSSRLGTRSRPLWQRPAWWLVPLLLAVSALAWRPLLGAAALRGSGQGLTGGQLRPFDTDGAGIWRLWRDAWGGPGLGGPNPDHPYLALLAPVAHVVGALPWVDSASSGATAVTWILVTGVFASGVSAYLAGRVVTRDGWLRLVVAVVWAGTGTLTAAIAQGRPGPVVAHVLIPLVLAGVFGTAQRSAGSPLTFGTVLAAAALGAFAPVALALTTIAALGIVILGPGLGARLRAAAVVVVPWALLGFGGVLRGDHEWRLLLAGPGALSSPTSASPLSLLLLSPGGPGSPTLWWGVPVLALAAVGLLVPARDRLRAQLGLAAVLVLALAAALASQRLVVTSVGGADRVPWAGIPLDVMAAAALGLGLLGLTGLGSTRRRTAEIAARVVLVPAAAAALAVGAALGPIESLRPAVASTPAVVAHQQHGPRSVRLLSLRVEQDGRVTHHLSGREAGLPARDLDLMSDGPAGVGGAQEITRATRALLDPGTTDDVRALLESAAVGYVRVQGASGAGSAVADLARTVSAAPGLSPMAGDAGSRLWRIEPEPATVPTSRLTVLDDQGRRTGVLPVTGPTARTHVDVPAGAAGRVLQVAQTPGWAHRAVVEFDGRPLPRVQGTGIRYALPARAGELVVHPQPAYPRIRVGQAILAGVCVFLAVPFGNARSRRRRP